MKAISLAPAVTVRTDFRPETDIAAVVELHDTIYRQEFNFGGDTFTHYVSEGLQEFTNHYNPQKDRVWLCELEGKLVGSLFLVNRGEAAQLRYFLLHADCRGMGLGNELISEFMQCLNDRGYRSCYLLTVKGLSEAAHLYLKQGFQLTEEKATTTFGVSLIEQRYDLYLPYILPAQLSDASLLRDLMEQTFIDTYAVFNTPENMQRHITERFGLVQVQKELQDENVQYLLVKQNGQLIGFAKLVKDHATKGLEGKKVIEIERIYVSHAYHGQKLGTKLMQTCLDWSKNKGFETVWLGVWEHNPKAISAFTKKWVSNASASTYLCWGARFRMIS
jgi:GNAT superfamily N-acetyltransferase